jgi:hypothetical protein
MLHSKVFQKPMGSEINYSCFTLHMVMTTRAKRHIPLIKTQKFKFKWMRLKASYKTHNNDK